MLKHNLENIVDEVRNKRLREKGGGHLVDDPGVLLLAECQQNSRALSEELAERDLTHTVVRGAIKDKFKPDEEPSSFADAKKLGLVHYWIECQGYVCEIASESQRHFGEAIVLAERPGNYIVFDDSFDHA